MNLAHTLAGVLLVGAAWVAAGQEDPVLVGTVSRVTDGDTITVELSSGPIIVRLASIDAPERDQPWGKESGAALAELLQGQEVALEVETQDRYERLVAVVYLGDGDVNGWMIEQGHAWAYRQYLSAPQYCSLEHDARTAGRGLWGLEQPAAPWEWRRPPAAFTDYSRESAASCAAAKGRPPSRAAAGEAPGACRIKGNIGDSGRIYHVPGSRSYEATRIDESRGERWFCTEEEARAAGWRPPRQ